MWVCGQAQYNQESPVLRLEKRRLRPSPICRDLGHQKARVPMTVRTSTPHRMMNSHRLFKRPKVPSASTLYHLQSDQHQLHGSSRVEIAAVLALAPRYLPWILATH